MKVLNIGSLNLDYVYEVDHIVAGGETESSGSMKVHCGGKGLNQSIALARAGVEVYHGGIVGSDGDALVQLCHDNGIHTGYIKRLEENSGHTIIQVDKNAQNCILLYGGCNLRFTKDYVDYVLEGFGRDDILLLQNEINLVDYIVDRAYMKGMKIILNPSPMNERLDRVDMKKISMFIMNEIEGGQMTGEGEPERILEKAAMLYPKADFMLTLGTCGSIYKSGDQMFYQEACPTKAVDTTAAGDTFTGYFIAGLLEGIGPQGSLLLAARASAIAVSRPGAAPSIPWRREL